jgi:tRNA(His) guanylyltransferase
MKFDELDEKMRVFETAHDHRVMPGIYMVARLDGRNFTRLTKETRAFKAPFDEAFRDYMTATVEHLMDCGFRVIYGYTQSDEISLLFHRDENAFGRKERKYNSILAGEGSAKFSLLMKDMACFDSRICQLPNVELVKDYFSWRQEDAHRNALNGHCYWMLRSEGLSVNEATERLVGISVADKNELLFSRGINFNDLPAWQKRGTGLYWQMYDKEGHNPITGETVTTKRRRIHVDFELPLKDDYREFIRTRIEENL